ncbi:hypothetical protein B0H10DRAFT_2217374 [Mycena sp. CBHHK59/15]|nr:hypothetical protein B0H10DRAFT_2217374 [Mycena sp. CBHHK59/15]
MVRVSPKRKKKSPHLAYNFYVSLYGSKPYEENETHPQKPYLRKQAASKSKSTDAAPAPDPTLRVEVEPPQTPVEPLARPPTPAPPSPRMQKITTMFCEYITSVPEDRMAVLQDFFFSDDKHKFTWQELAKTGTHESHAEPLVDDYRVDEEDTGQELLERCGKSPFSDAGCVREPEEKENDGTRVADRGDS